MARPNRDLRRLFFLSLVARLSPEENLSTAHADLDRLVLKRLFGGQEGANPGLQRGVPGEVGRRPWRGFGTTPRRGEEGAEDEAEREGEDCPGRESALLLL